MWIIPSVLLFPIILSGVLGLRLIDVVVPQHANLGQSVTLWCKFDLGSGRLYSVKWYKDEFEFFRYMPNNIPQMQYFQQPGVKLENSKSNMSSVTLTEVTYKSTGTYKCEVSTEAPNFDTVFRNGNMTVLAFPDGSPAITGVKDTYSVAEYVTANCTSALSNPAPRLSWFINGVKAESFLLDKYQIVEHPGPLYSRSLGLRFLAEKRHFQGPGSSITLKCSIGVADLPAQTATVTPRLASASANQKLAQERLSNHGNARTDSCCGVFSVLLLILLLRHS